MRYQSLRVRSASVHLVLLALVAFHLSGCSSPEDRAKSYYEHGMQLLAAHDNARAEIEFLNAVKYDKKLLPAWKSLAQIDEETQNWKQMVPVLRNVVELDPNDMDARIKLGRLLLLAGAFDDALHVANDTKEGDSQNADLLALKAAILYKLRDSAGAVRDAEEALKIDPQNTGAMMVLAGDHFARGDAKGALDILNSPSLAKRDDVGVALFKLQIFEKTQDLQQSEAVLQKLITQYPKELNFRRALIRLYVFQHRYEDAEKEQRSVVAADPSNIQAQLDLVSLLTQIKGPAAGAQELDNLINTAGDTFPYQIALARLNFSQGKFADSEAALKKLISDANSSADHVLAARVTLAEMYLARKEIDSASALVSDILSKDARNIGGLRLRASIELDRNQTDAAIADLRQALNDQPRATDIMLQLAIAYERSGSIDLAEKEFADAMRMSNFDPTVSLNYVAFLQRRGSLPHAEDVVTDLASRWPKNIAVLSALGQIRLARQEWAGAQQVAEMIKSIGSNRIAADELLGAALAGRNKFDESIVALQDAYQSAPNAPQPMYALVQTYLRAGKPDQALAFLQSVLKANPSSVEAYVLLGSVQLTNKAPDQARQSFMTAIAKDPKNAIGYKALANYYILQKDYAQAQQTTRAGLAEQPDNFPLLLTLADVFERTGDYDAAISEYQSLLTKDPGSIIIANNLASLLADHRTDKASLAQAEKLVEILQKSPTAEFKDTIGWVRYRQEDYKAALPLLEEAATAMPGAAVVHYHLGMNYLAVGQADKAAEQFKIALAQAPDHDLEEKIHAALTQ